MSAVDSSSLRIVSYNIHACVGRDGRFMPERIVSVLRPLDADFVALQEVEDRPFDQSTVAQFLAARLDMHAYRGVTLRRDDADYGNLLLARQMAQRHSLHDISVPGAEPRGCIEADFIIGERRLRLFATHLGLSAAERLQQLRQLSPTLANEDMDVKILAGDINEWRRSGRVLRALHDIFGTAPRRRTFPSNLPTLALDRICVSPRTALAALSTVTTPECRVASDHLPLVCDVTFSVSR